MIVWSYIGFLIVIFVLFRFIKALGKGLPILELLLLIAGFQWIVGPIIEYNFPSNHFKYFMYVSEPIYMGFVVPAYLFFVGIIFIKLKNYQSIELPIERLANYDRYGLVIFFLGVVFDLSRGFLPGSLSFFAFILANFKFAGAIILYFSNNKNLKWLFYLSIVYLFLISLKNAMFHDFILWSAFFYMFWAIKHKPSLKIIVITFIIGGFLIVSLQTVKAAFRSEVWSGFSGNKVTLFTDLFFDSVVLSFSSNGSDNIDTENNVRLNQGWIISAIMNHVPNNQPYLNGETVLEALSASLLPRFLNPTKAEAGGRKNFEKFTGIGLSKGTSMGISIVGEAYGNFNVIGGIFFMGVWGWFLVKIWLILLRYGFNNIIFFAFIPIIFLQVIKAETELVVVLNHLVKSSIVVFTFFFFVKKKLKWRLNND